MLRTALIAPLAALGLLPMTAAHAADAVTCTIVDTSPDTVVIGLTPETFQIDVATDCDAERDVSWQVTSDIYPGSSGASWLMLRNYDYPYGEKFSFREDPEGRVTLDPVHDVGPSTLAGNGWAGVRPLHAAAFHDANGDGVLQFEEPVTYSNSSFTLKRATTFGTSFDAWSAGVKRGHKVTVSGRLQRADWSTGAYANHNGTAVLQFRANGTANFVDVKPVAVRNGVATTCVVVPASGFWRYRYAGDDVSGPSVSNADWVTAR